MRGHGVEYAVANPEAGELANLRAAQWLDKPKKRVILTLLPQRRKNSQSMTTTNPIVNPAKSQAVHAGCGHNPPLRADARHSDFHDSHVASGQFLDVATEDVFLSIKNDIHDEYQQAHNHPWIIGYSGGKDSTLVAHLVFEMLMELPPSERTREIHVVANNTLVESPLVIEHIQDSMLEIEYAAAAFNLPVAAKITSPNRKQSFWVNLIGRGYPSPNQHFRWCTDRMKIRPTSDYIRGQVNSSGQVILLLGVRRSESNARRASMNRYDNGQRLNQHNDLAGCLVFRPIVELSTDDVWEYLGAHNPPWGGSHQKLIKLYRDADGGECPVITQKSDAATCGTASARFGCWTCTVVDKDRSLAGFVDSGFHEFKPLLEFRDWLVSIRNDPKRRMARRRDGRITLTARGALVPGPYTLETRFEMLEKLLALQEQTGRDVISPEEVEFIKTIWAEDAHASATMPLKIRTIGRKQS